MAKTKRRNNKVRRTRSRRGGVRGNDSYLNASKIPYTASAKERGFQTDPNWAPPRTFPVSNMFGIGKAKPQKKNMYERFVYNRQKQIEKIRRKSNLTDDDLADIQRLTDEIEYYKNKNKEMLREGATRSNYPLLKRAKELRYDAARTLLGEQGYYDSDSDDSENF